MTIENGEMDYTLKRPIQFSDNGASTDGRLLVLREPTMQHAKHYMKLKQMIKPNK